MPRIRQIDRSNLRDLALGATLLGSGGGGLPGQTEQVAMECLRKLGPMDIVETRELSDDALVIGIGLLGTPAAIGEKIPSPPQFIHAIRSLESHLGRRADAVMPLSTGGMMALLPVLVSNELGVPCVDADGMRRAFPQVEMTTMTMVGLSASPMSVADDRGNHIIVNTATNSDGERLVRAATMQMGLSTALASYPMTRAEAMTGPIQGSMSYVIELGAALRRVQAHRCTWEEFLSRFEGNGLINGRVIDVTREPTIGYAESTVLVESLDDASSTLRIETQNEYLIAVLDGVVMETPPNPLCLVDLEDARPIPADTVSVGDRVRVFSLPCAPEWHRPGMSSLAGPSAFGYGV